MKKQVIGKIYSTTDYASFRYRQDNRTINTRTKEFRKLLKSIEEIGQKQAVLVDAENFIIDGQHRVEACKILGIPVVITTDKDGATTNDLIQLQNKKEWTLADRASSFSIDNENYKWYNVFSDRYPEFKHTIKVMLLSGQPERVKKIEDDFKVGIFKVKSFNKACEIAEMLREFEPYYKGYKKRGFVAAILTMKQNKDFELRRMLRKMPIRAKSLMDFSKTEDYIEVLEEMYNWKESKKVYFTKQ